MLRTPQKVGTITLSDDLYISLPHEVAAWFTELQIKAGEHELFMITNPDTGKPQLFLSEPNALIVEDSTPSLFGGVAVSEGNSKKGQTMSQTKSIPLTSEGIIHGHRGKVEFSNNLVQPFLSTDEEGKITLDKDHPAFHELIMEENIEMAVSSLTSNRAGKELQSLYTQNGWDNPDKLRILIEAGVASHTFKHVGPYWKSSLSSHDDIIRQFGGMIKTDELLRNYYDTSLDSKDIDVNEVYKIYKSKGGEVSNFPAMTVKTMSEVGMIQYTKPELDSDNTY